MFSSSNITPPKISPFQITFLGDSQSGKDSLVRSLFELNRDVVFPRGETFNVPYTPSEGFYDRSVSALNLQLYIFRFTSRYERNYMLPYRRARLIVIVVDLTSESSLQDMFKWRNEIERYGPEKVSVLVLGMKSDLQDERVGQTEDEIEHLVNTSMDCQYMEMSKFNPKRSQFLNLVKAIFNEDIVCSVKESSILSSIPISSLWPSGGSTTPPSFGLNSKMLQTLNLNAIKQLDIPASTSLILQSTGNTNTFTIEATDATSSLSNTQPICDQLFKKEPTTKVDQKGREISYVFGSRYLMRQILDQVHSIHQRLGLWTVKLTHNKLDFWCSHPNLIPLLHYKVNKCGHDPIQFKYYSQEFTMFLRNNRDLKLLKQSCMAIIKDDNNNNNTNNRNNNTYLKPYMNMDDGRDPKPVIKHSWIIDEACISGSVDIIKYLHRLGYNWTIDGFLFSIMFDNLDVTKYIIENSSKRSKKEKDPSQDKKIKDKKTKNKKVGPTTFEIIASHNSQPTTTTTSSPKILELTETHLKNGLQLAQYYKREGHVKYFKTTVNITFMEKVQSFFKN